MPALAPRSGAPCAHSQVQRLIGAGAALQAATALGVPVNIAIDKTYTAASFGLPTSQWHEALASHSAAVHEGLVLRPRFVAFGGGLPITEGGARIGAIGVSRGSEAQDETIARAGL